MKGWYVALLIAGLGHACWDNSFRWLVSNDPETSVLHMHWVRMCFMTLLLMVASWKAPPVAPHTTTWWLWFSLSGFVLPPLCYTCCAYLTGYRIAISIQTFIPLFLLCWQREWPSIPQCRSLICVLLGTLCLWWNAPWINGSTDLWMVWFSVVAAFTQAWSLSIWFQMLSQLRGGHLRAVTGGSTLGLCLLFVTFVMWSPQHLAAASMGQVDVWLVMILGCALSTACKYWVISRASVEMSVDAVSILECLHPIATLVVDLLHQRDQFGPEDVAAVVCISVGWILYPTTPI